MADKLNELHVDDKSTSDPLVHTADQTSDKSNELKADGDKGKNPGENDADTNAPPKNTDAKWLLTHANIKRQLKVIPTRICNYC